MNRTSNRAKGIEGLWSILLPCTGTRSAGRWVLHFVLLATVAGGLCGLNAALDVERLLRSPWPVLHKLWLPLLFLLIYALCWLGYCLRGLLGLSRPLSPFPELDSAWGKALAGLEGANIALKEVPLFLVLGKPAGGTEALFEAAGIPMVLIEESSQWKAGLNLFANHDGIFVTCTETSLIGKQAMILAEQAAPASPRATPLGPVQAVLAKAHAEGRGPGELTGEEKQEITRLVALQKTPAATEESTAIPLWENETAMGEVTARLEHLCRLIARDRRPYCPINGLALLLPLAATTADNEAGQVADLTQRDVQAVHRSLELDCPIFVLVCDLEQAPGFATFIDRCSEAARLRPLGHRFPLMPDVDPHEVQAVIEKGVGHLSDPVLTDAIYQRFEAEPTSSGALATNVSLYQLLALLRGACERLRHILYRGTQIELGAPSLVTGCYLAATGADANRDQAFVADIFEEFIKNQNHVAWSPRALAEESAQLRLARLGYVGLSLVLVILGVLGYLWTSGTLG